MALTAIGLVTMIERKDPFGSVRAPCMHSSSGPVTTIASWLRPICLALQQRGMDSQMLLQAADIDPALLLHPQARVPIKAMRMLWRLAVTATGDDAFGLEVASITPFTGFHALGFAIQSSSNVHDAIMRMVRFYQVVSNSVQLHYQRDQECRLTLMVPEGEERPAPEGIDAFMALFVCRARTLLGFDMHEPLRLSLMRPPPKNIDAFQQLFRCPIRFGANTNELCFPGDLANRPLLGADPEVALQNERIVADYLARLNQGSLRQQLHECLIQSLPSGVPEQAEVASRLGLSSRTLQRRLQEEGTTFQAVLDEVRFALAKAHLCTRQYSLGEIGYLLGFSEQSNFTRAFKRWAGVTPAEFASGQRERKAKSV